MYISVAAGESGYAKWEVADCILGSINHNCLIILETAARVNTRHILCLFGCKFCFSSSVVKAKITHLKRKCLIHVRHTASIAQ